MRYAGCYADLPDALANFLRECGLQKSQCVNLGRSTHTNIIEKSAKMFVRMIFGTQPRLEGLICAKNTKHFQDRAFIFEGLCAVSLTHYQLSRSHAIYARKILNFCEALLSFLCKQPNEKIKKFLYWNLLKIINLNFLN